jgi:AbrB family looped-hinge helix DNA binding protein
MTDPATTTLSSKGQIVIPEEIRARLGLKAGAQFVVVGDRDVVILKMLKAPAMKEFSSLVARTRREAKLAGIKRSAVAKAVAKVRRVK